VKMPGGSFAMVTREPYGVVGGVGAWNYPLQTCTWKVAPALACGNTFVYKPSQFTPAAAVVMGEVRGLWFRFRFRFRLRFRNSLST
jgi:aldehyde dehydrogenase family 9 protein A1